MAAIYACCAILLPSLLLPLCMHRPMSNTASDDNHGKINSSVSFYFLQSMHNEFILAQWKEMMMKSSPGSCVLKVSVIKCQSAPLINT